MKGKGNAPCAAAFLKRIVKPAQFDRWGGLTFYALIKLMMRASASTIKAIIITQSDIFSYLVISTTSQSKELEGCRRSVPREKSYRNHNRAVKGTPDDGINA